jgi:hypothetical protein
MDDVPDYIVRAGIPKKKDERYPPVVRRPGPPEGEDYFTLTERHGRPVGVFEQHGRTIPYKG